MKLPFSLAAVSRTALAALALTFTVSCLPNSGPFAGGGPFNSQPAVTGSGGERTYVETTTRSRRPAVAATSFFFGGGGGYHSSGYCRSCGYNPCRCSSRSHYGSSSHYGHGHGSSHSGHSGHSGYSPSSSNRSSSSSSHNHKAEHPHAHDTYRIAGGSVRSTQTKPSGFHSLDWYKSRGYDTSKLKLENEHGQSKGHSSRSSSSKSGSSGSSKSKSSGSSKSKSSGSSSKESSKYRGRLKR